MFGKGGLDPGSFCGDGSGPVSTALVDAGAGGDPAGRVSTDDFARFLNGESSNDIWELWLAASKTSYIVSQCIATTEPSYFAKHGFQLSQLFNTFYHLSQFFTTLTHPPQRSLLPPPPCLLHIL